MSDQNIIKAQQGLARKAQTQRSHRFEDLYFLLYKREWIAEALDHVLSNSGALTPGIDGQSRNDLDNPQARERFIDTLQAELKSQHYQPQPVKRVEIPKPGTDKKRPLGI